MPRPAVGLIDYRMGNLHSVQKAFENSGADVILISDAANFVDCDAIVLPGQGHFGEAMRNLKAGGLIDRLREHIEAGGRYFGICLGLQVLFEAGDEDPEAAGFGIFSGKVSRFPETISQNGETRRLITPAMGWNLVVPAGGSSLIERGHYYFDHSFYISADSAKGGASIVTGVAEYGVPYAAAVSYENIFAVQFHPEKSSIGGLALIRRYLASL